MDDVNYVAIEDSCVFVKNLFVLNPRNTKTHDVNKNMITCKEGIIFIIVIQCMLMFILFLSEIFDQFCYVLEIGC